MNNAGAHIMQKAAIINTRIEPELKANAESILKEVGLSSAEAIRIFYKQICLQKGLPFEVKVPNALTRETLDKSARGEEVKRFDSIDDLFKDLES
jgi:DNA-damage-inducible protein J